MRLPLISLLALLSIGQADAERLQFDDPLQIVGAPPGRLLFQDKRGFWEDSADDLFETLLRELNARDGLGRPLTLDLLIPSGDVKRR
jgi:hypothetical protein